MLGGICEILTMDLKRVIIGDGALGDLALIGMMTVE